jgi:hypothetical protein
VQYPIRQLSLYLLLWEPEILHSDEFLVSRRGREFLDQCDLASQEADLTLLATVSYKIVLELKDSLKDDSV